jgi:hypothetical protein
MFLDSLISLSTLQPITTASIASTTIYDVTGAGSGNVSNMIGGVNTSGTAVSIGFDIGAGDGMAIPEVIWNIGASFSTSGGATFTIALQAAPDNGSNSPGTWTTLVQTQAFTAAQLTGGTIGQFQVPPVPPGFGEVMPRFYRLFYTVGSSTFVGGSITANIVLNPSQATKIQDYPGNYVA